MQVHVDNIHEAMTRMLELHRSGLLDDAEVTAVVNYVALQLAFIQGAGAPTVTLPVMTLAAIAADAGPQRPALQLIQGGRA